MLRESLQIQAQYRRESAESTAQLREVLAGFNRLQRTLEAQIEHHRAPQIVTSTPIVPQSTLHSVPQWTLPTSSHASPNSVVTPASTTTAGEMIRPASQVTTSANASVGIAATSIPMPPPLYTTAPLRIPQSNGTAPAVMLSLEPAQSAMSQLFIHDTIEPIPKFDGCNIKAWPRFLSTYRYQVGRQVPADQLISNLSKALHGEAYELVADQIMWRQDHGSIINTLCTAYGDAAKVIDSLAREIVNAKPPRELPRHLLRQFAIKVKQFVTGVTYLGHQNELSSIYLERTIISKLRDEHKDLWCRMKRDHPALNIGDLNDFLLERCTDFSAEPPEPRPTRQQHGPPAAPGASTRVGFHANTDEYEEGDTANESVAAHNQGSEQNVSTKHCFDCGGSHSLVNCKKFINRTVQDRSTLAASKRICASCLAATDHVQVFCEKSSKCNYPGCDKAHHWLLHSMEANKQS